MSNVLIYAEHAHGDLPKATAIAVAAGKKAASITGGETILAVLADSIGGLAEKAAALGTTKVVTVENPLLAHANADVTAKALKAVADSTGSTFVVFASTTTGKDVAPRLAGAMDAAIATDVTEINDDGSLVRPMYAGNGPCVGGVRSHENPAVGAHGETRAKLLLAVRRADGYEHDLNVALRFLDPQSFFDR